MTFSNRMESTEKCEAIIQHFNGKYIKTPPGVPGEILFFFFDCSIFKQEIAVEDINSSKEFYIRDTDYILLYNIIFSDWSSAVRALVV